jgi:hypothetical protein
MFFQEDHLRITKVKTIDGTSPLIGEDERPVKKVIFAPLNPLSKKLLEDQNTRLPTNLKMKIETVKAYKPEPIPAAPTEDVGALKLKLQQLEQENKSLKESKIEAPQPNGLNNLVGDTEDLITAATPLQSNKSKIVGHESK